VRPRFQKRGKGHYRGVSGPVCGLRLAQRGNPREPRRQEFQSIGKPFAGRAGTGKDLAIGHGDGPFGNSELLSANDPRGFADHGKLVGGNIRNGLSGAVCPANSKMRNGFTAQPEVQAAIVHRIETGLRTHLLRLLPVSVASTEKSTASQVPL
jgi:hypothetical protein